MSARDFDKALQEKAQQLRLEPSPRVWAGVAEELHRKRRRKGAAWIFGTAALVAGLAFLVVENYHESNMPGKNFNSEKVGKNSLNKEEQTLTSTTPDLDTNNYELNNNAIDHNSTLPPSPTAAGSKLPSAALPAPRNLVNSTGGKTKSKQNNLSTPGGKPQMPQIGDMPSYFAISSNENSNITLVAPEKRDESRTENGPDTYTRQLEGVNINGISNNGQSISVKAPAERVLNNPIDPLLITRNKLSKPDKWHISLQFAAGSSSLVESGLQQYNSLANEYLSSVMIPAGIATIQQRPSDVKAGPAFMAGGQLNRSLTRKLSAGIGVQYAFYSNRITVGNSPDSTVAIYNSRQELVNSNATYKAAGNTGNTFYNQFHFIQVPVDLTWNLDNNQHWYMNAGISIGYLIGTNALQYNNQAGVYYHNNEVLRKWQTELFTGFQYKFLTSHKVPFWVGPFAKYQLNSLDQTSSNKHWLLFGVGAKFQLK
ncbi:outer membrane beta-barrel protein [Flavihumibacter fluvii]|uniref:outer membrane beta-barrel protein n=1 Tax=Flavihumibacter fluvii TaxID=2838157 RepID=UPI001BDE0B2B|nr:outer membrane beta-barrel protein [Flavihumibacter fluvii]ULQ53710.1 PorT family protein [Flavihumibacter fluvii]